MEGIVNDEFIPFTEQDCLNVIDKYGTDDCLLWDKFWLFMSKQSAAGAGFEYVESCYGTLESIWIDKKEQ
jgi:hypothetical protein